MILNITPLGVENLRYDANGDGIFESVLEPTAAAIGESARDADAPVIAFTESGIGASRLVSIGATDAMTGVKIIRYSLDGQRYYVYSGPIAVSACNASRVYAVADDNVGNRSEVFTYELPNRPPDVSQARASIDNLWPPNHKMVGVSILGVTEPDCDPLTITITLITQNEPTEGPGDGITCPDAIGLGTFATHLRAERNGGGNGRVYTIYFKATDGKGGESYSSVRVMVPKSSHQNTATDDTVILDSTVCGGP